MSQNIIGLKTFFVYVFRYQRQKLNMYSKIRNSCMIKPFKRDDPEQVCLCSALAEETPKNMKKKTVIFLLMVFFVESHLKIIKWSKIVEIGPNWAKITKNF